MPIKLTLFFTYGVSLDIWAQKGLLNRELKIYEELIKKHDMQIQLLTYGNESDYQWVKDFKGLTVLPVYSRINFSKSKIVRFLQSLLIPWKFRTELADQNIFKTNQMLGGWVAVLSKLIFKKPLIVRCGYEIYNFHKLQNKPFKITSEKAYILKEKPEIVYMRKMVVTLDLGSGRIVKITSDKGSYNKITYDCFFQQNVEATDGGTKIIAENLDLLSAKNLVEIYNDVELDYVTGSLKADKINYNFETKNFKISMFDDKAIKMKIIK